MLVFDRCHLCEGNGYIYIPRFIFFQKRVDCPACKMYYVDSQMIMKSTKEEISNAMEIFTYFGEGGQMKVVGKIGGCKCNMYADFLIEPGNEQHVKENLKDEAELFRSILLKKFMDFDFNYSKDFDKS